MLRILTAEDIDAYRALRLEALRSSPESFGAHVEDEEKLPLAELTQRIVPTERSWVLGAFDERTALLGLMGWYRERGQKNEHRSMIWGAYVQPSHRRSSVGAGLLAMLLDRVRTVPGLRQVQLHVSAGNFAAKGLYAKFGFQFVALHPQSLRIAERFIDEELWTLRLRGND